MGAVSMCELLAWVQPAWVCYAGCSQHGWVVSRVCCGIANSVISVSVL